MNCDAVDFVTDQVGGYVKGGFQGKPAFVEIKILDQSLPQIACADDDQLVVAIHAENRTDLRAQDFHIIAVALLAKFSEAAQILSDLRGGDAHFASQGTGRDRF